MDYWLKNFVYKTTISWWIFAVSGLAAILITWLTISYQSYKAAGRNPVEVLRYE
jgi:putative ABC transport system permease protein